MHKKRRVSSVLLLIVLLLSLIPVKLAVQAEDSFAGKVIPVDATIRDDEGYQITKDNPVQPKELVTISLGWQMEKADIIKEGEARSLTLPPELTYVEKEGTLPDGMGSFKITNGSVIFTFAKNYQMKPEERVPDYSSVKQYQGVLTIQAEIPETENTELTLDFGNQTIQQVFVQASSTESPGTSIKLNEDSGVVSSSENNYSKESKVIPAALGHDLNERGIGVIRSMDVLDENKQPFTEGNPPMRDDNIQIDFTWSLNDNAEVNAGDYYCFELPEYFSVHTEIDDEALVSSDPNVPSLGSFNLKKQEKRDPTTGAPILDPVTNEPIMIGILTVTFNENVSKYSGRSGKLEISTQLDVDTKYDEIINSETYTEEGTPETTTTVKIAQADITKKGEIGSDNLITWEVIINQKNLKLRNPVVTDFIGSDQAFVSATCYVPSETVPNGWERNDSISHIQLDSSNNYKINFPDLKTKDKTLDHAVKWVITTRITNKQANTITNEAAIEGDNFNFMRTQASVNVSELDSYKFMLEPNYAEGILTWRLKVTIPADNRTIIDQMYAEKAESASAIHYLNEESLEVKTGSSEGPDYTGWKFKNDETKKKEGKIVRFGITFDDPGVYYINYQTRAFKVPLPTGVMIENLLWVGGKLYNGGEEIGDKDLIAIEKSHETPDYTNRKVRWSTDINTGKIKMSNATFTDLFRNEKGTHLSGLDLIPDSVKIYELNDKGNNEIELTKKNDYDIDTNYQAGGNGAKGFLITLKGKYATTDKAFRIVYDTYFHMENQPKDQTGKYSPIFYNYAQVSCTREGKTLFGSSEDHFEVPKDYQQNGLKYGSYVDCGEIYKDQASPFYTGQPEMKDSVCWSVAFNGWGLKLPIGTEIKEVIHEGQTNCAIQVYTAAVAGEEASSGGTIRISKLDQKLEVDKDYTISTIPNSNTKLITLLKPISKPIAIFMKADASVNTFRYKNIAEMKVDGAITHVEAQVDKSYKTDWLEKDGKQVGHEGDYELQADWSLTINKGSRTIETPIVTDTITTNEQIFEVKNGKVQVEIFEAQKNSDGNWVPVGNPIDLEKAGWTVSIRHNPGLGTQTLEIEMGKTISSPYIIKYRTIIDPGVENGTKINNSALLTGSGKTISLTEKTIEVKSTQGSGTSTGVDGSLKIEKVDEEKQLIKSDVKFDIFRVDDQGKRTLYLSVTVNEGRIVKLGNQTVNLEKIDHLRYGNYAIQETQAPKDYQLDDTIYPFTISEQIKDYVYEAVNKKNNVFELSILKKNAIGNRLLAGGVFTLTAENSSTVIGTTTTEKNGIGKFIDANKKPCLLESGNSYTVKETKAPDGFVKLKGDFTVAISQEGKVSVKYAGDDLDKDDMKVAKGIGDENTQIQFTARNNERMPLPKTGGAGWTLLIISGLLGLAIGWWYFLPKKEGL